MNSRSTRSVVKSVVPSSSRCARSTSPKAPSSEPDHHDSATSRGERHTSCVARPPSQSLGRQREVPRLVSIGLGGGDAGELANLGVGHLAVREGPGDERQAPQGTGDADVLAGGARGEADAPGEPAAQEGKPLAQPAAASNSRISVSRRETAASRWAASSAISSPTACTSAQVFDMTSPPCVGDSTP
jgi:hypothetical protein